MSIARIRSAATPRPLAALLISFALTLACAASAFAAARPNYEVRGVPQVGAQGVSRTVTDIMAEQETHAGEVITPVLMPEHEGLDRTNLPQNPLSPHAAGVPNMTLDQLMARASASAVLNPFTPQTVGVNFTAATLSGTNPTGSFPADNDGAVGPTQYIVAVNGRIVSFNKTTGVADGVLNASTDVFFTSVRSGSSTSDPMIRFDRLSNRWFVSIINVSTPNRWLLAVSDAASNGVISAGTVWTYYFFIPATTSPAIPNGNTCLSDYPSLGIDANALYTGVSQFCGSGQPFQQTDVFVIRKSSVLTGGPIVVTAFRALMNAAGGYVGPYTARGIDNYDPSANEGYFISTDGASYGTLWLNRVTNPGGAPTLSSNIQITVPATDAPRPVPHPGNTGGYWGRLDAIDDRLFSAHIRNHQLWTAHNVGVDNTGASQGTYLGDTRVGARWYHMNVPVGSGTPTIVESGTVFTPSATNDSLQKNCFIPSIMVSGQGHAAMGFSTAGQNDFVNVATVGRLASDTPGTMGTIQQITTNTANTYNPASDPGGISAGGPRRWGDYSITSLDPLDDMSMWTVQQFVNANNSYGVRVAKLIAPPPATPSAMADVQTGQANASITLTGLSSSGSGFFDPGADLPAPARPFTHISASVSAGAASGTPPSVVSVTYVNPTTATVVLNTTSATANLASEKYTMTVTNPDGQTASGAVVHVVAANSATITASAGSGGTITPSGAVSVTLGNNQSFTIAPDACHTIQDVLVDGVSQGAVTTYTLTNVQAPHTIAASFALKTYTIAASAGSGGSIAPNGNTILNCGANQSYTITPNGGFHVQDVLVNGVSVGAVTTYSFTNVTANQTIAASFAVTPVDNQAPVVTLTSPAGGESWNVGSSHNITWTATDNVGVTAVDLALSTDGGATFPTSIATGLGNTGTFAWALPLTISNTARVRAIAHDAAGNIGSDSTHTNFTMLGYTIAASSGANGAVTPAGTSIVADGATPAYTITPNTGYHVADVLVNGVSASAVTTYNFAAVHANQTISASFAINSYTLVVTPVGSGTVSIVPNQANYNHGTSVTLTATPNAGFQFAGWSVDTTGSTNPLTFNMTTNKNITATFTAVALHQYTWNATGSASFATSTNWTPTRSTPATDDQLFFSGGGSVTATGVTTQTIGQLTVSNNTNVALQPATAQTLTIAGGTGTDLTVGAGSTLTLNGASALTIAVATGATAQVNGNVAVTAAAHRLTAADAGSLVFAGGSTITLGTGFAGNVFGTTSLNSVVFQSGSMYVQSAGANPFGATAPNSVVQFQAGSRFRLDGALAPSLANRTYADFEYNNAGAQSPTGGTAVTMDSLIVTQGTFNVNLTGGANIHGSINVKSGATLTFTPASAANFALNGTATQNVNIAGTFTPGASATLVINNAAGVNLLSNLSLSTPLTFTSGRVNTGGSTLAIAAAGALSGAGAGTGWVNGNLKRNLAAGSTSRTFDVGDATTYAPVTVAMNGAASALDLTASTKAGDHANLASSDLDGAKSVNRTWTITPTGSPTFTSYDPTFNFAASDLDAGANTANLQVRRYNAGWTSPVTGARTSTSTQATGLTGFGDFAVAEIAVVNFTINASAGANGSITPGGAVSMPSGGGQGFTITPAANYHVADVLVDGVSVGAVTNYNFTNVIANHTIAASFAINTFAITASAGANGGISPSGAVNVNAGASQGFTITPAASYHVLDVLADGASVGAVTTYNFTNVLANHTIAASFAINVHTITASAGTGGSISPAGPVNVNEGAGQSFTIAANTGYHLVDVLVDGSSVGAVANYSFTNVTADHTIAASFTIVTYTLSVNVVGGGSVNVAPNPASYPYGTPVTLTAVPAAGNAFIGWSGDTTTAGNPLSIVITANRSFTATFADTAAPSVAVTAPNGGQSLLVGAHTNLTWTAADNAGVTVVDLFLSRAGVAGPYDSIATNQANSGTYDWIVTGPSTSQAFLKVVAHDAAGNTASDKSDDAFAITSTTGVDDGPVTAFALSSVVPNPMRGVAHVTFALPRAARVHVGVLDVQGREVLTLADGEYGAGRHVVQLANVHAFTPGLYFVRMTAPGHTLVNRFAVMR